MYILGPKVTVLSKHKALQWLVIPQGTELRQITPTSKKLVETVHTDTIIFENTTTPTFRQPFTIIRSFSNSFLLSVFQKLYQIVEFTQTFIKLISNLPYNTNSKAIVKRFHSTLLKHTKILTIQTKTQPLSQLTYEILRYRNASPRFSWTFRTVTDFDNDT